MSEWEDLVFNCVYWRADRQDQGRYRQSFATTKDWLPSGLSGQQEGHMRYIQALEKAIEYLE